MTCLCFSRHSPADCLSALSDKTQKLEAGIQSILSYKDRTKIRGCDNLQQDGSVAQTKIKLRHGDCLIVDTLVGTVQLNAFRRFLAEGFQTHLQQNPLLHQIFNFEPREERTERLTPLEKKMYRQALPTLLC